MRLGERGRISFAYWKVRPILPTILRTSVDRFMKTQSLTTKQLEEIKMLGRRIGLDKKEIYAAAGGSIGDAQLSERRITPLTACIMILIIIIISFVILVVGNYLNPPSVYGFGTRYGSIKPQDFISD